MLVPAFFYGQRRIISKKRTLKFTKPPANNHYTDTEALLFDEVISHTHTKKIYIL